MSKPFYDQVSSIDTHDGICWAYIKDNKIIDQTFLDWKTLYKIQVENMESFAPTVKFNAPSQPKCHS